MLEAMLACRAQLRPAIEGSLPGVTPAPKLYMGTRPDNAVLPHAWMRPGNETPFYMPLARNLDIVYLDIFGRSTDEVQKMENAASILDDAFFPNFGNARNVYYRLQSKTLLIEGEATVHSTILYEVRYSDARRLSNT